MFKYLIITGFLAINLFVNAQSDSLSKKSKINHLIGVESGYTSHYHLVGNNSDFSLSYIFNYKKLLIKGKFGITPSSNFGLLKKAFLSFGYTTKINKVVSWNILAGFGSTSGSKDYYQGDVFPTRYRYGTITPMIETGILFNPFKSNHLLFGLNGCGFTEKIVNIDIGDPFFNFRSYVINLNINILYKF